MITLIKVLLQFLQQNQAYIKYKRKFPKWTFHKDDLRFRVVNKILYFSGPNPSLRIFLTLILNTAPS